MVKIKLNEHIFFLIITLNTILTSMDADIYVPSFPDMMHQLATSEEKIQMILSANFLGLCFASLFYGPCADRFGRRKPLLLGLTIFVIGAIGSWYSTTINQLIIWRFIQGLGSAAPIIIGSAAIFDVYKQDRAIQLIAIWNSIGTATMATAPILGGFIGQHYGWRYIFLFILIVSILLIIAVFIFFKESLREEYKTECGFSSMLGEYGQFLKSFPFMANSCICALMYTALMVYISNLSLIFIDYLKILPQHFSYYQASTMCNFVIFSIISAKVVHKYGIEFTKKLGIRICMAGTVTLMLVAYFKTNSAVLICLAMAIYATGVAFAIGIFGAAAMKCFPKIKGTAAAIGTSIRLLLTSVIIVVSGTLFNGTILPIAWIICTMFVISYILYFLLSSKNAL